MGFPIDETNWIRKEGIVPALVVEFDKKLKLRITFENDERKKAAIAAEIEESGKVFIPICDICLTVLWKTAETRVTLTKCGHGTHTDCFEQWAKSRVALELKPSCCKDRTELNSEGVDYFKSYIDGKSFELKTDSFKEIPF